MEGKQKIVLPNKQKEIPANLDCIEEAMESFKQKLDGLKELSYRLGCTYDCDLLESPEDFVKVYSSGTDTILQRVIGLSKGIEEYYRELSKIIEKLDEII